MMGKYEKLDKAQKPTADEPKSYAEAKAEFDRRYLHHLLTWAHGNVQKAARKAQRDRKGLYIMMAKYGISPMKYRQGYPRRRS